MVVRIAAAIACVAAVGLTQQPPRDRVPVRTEATGRIAGVALSDEFTPRPLRRARVMLNGDLPGTGLTTIAQDDGSFVFEGLAAGRYTLGAVKEAYVPMNYGARRPGRRGVPIVLRDGETRQVTLELPRGAVITGAITDLLGQPAAGVRVQVLARMPEELGGIRRPLEMWPGMPQGPLNATDERGVYRIFGLPAGTYVVGAQPHLPSGTMLMAGDTREFVPAAVFYPGTTIADRVTRIKVRAGEERSGIDFQLQLVPTATISGTIPVAASGQLPAVRLIPKGLSKGTRSTRSASGQFTFRGVAPGTYSLIAESGTEVFAADITVDGTDLSGIGLAPQPRLTISGRVVFDGPAAPKRAAPLRVPLDMSFSRHVWGVNAVIDPDGRFVVDGLRGGEHRIIGVRGLRSPIGKWWIRSIVAEGRELLDGPVEIRHPLNDVVVTLSERTSKLSGVVLDPQGKPRPDFSVIAFGTYRETWFYNSRRIAAVDPDDQGRYTIHNLPPGDYYLVVTDELNRSEWFDPQILNDLVPRAMRISIGAYEQKRMDVVVR